MNLSKIACYYSVSNEDMFFAVKFSDKDYERGKALALEGWNAWWASEQVDGETWSIQEFPHLTVEEINALWGCGYTEGALDLLDKFHIEHEIITGSGCPDVNDGWPEWFDPNTIDDWFSVGDKI